MKGTEEEVSKRGGLWERRYANVPVCGDKSRGSCWRRRRRLSGLCPRLGRIVNRSQLLFATKQTLQFKPKTYIIPFIVFWGQYWESSTRRGAAVVDAYAAEMRGRWESRLQSW